MCQAQGSWAVNTPYGKDLRPPRALCCRETAARFLGKVDGARLRPEEQGGSVPERLVPALGRCVRKDSEKGDAFPNSERIKPSQSSWSGWGQGRVCPCQLLEQKSSISTLPGNVPWLLHVTWFHGEHLLHRAKERGPRLFLERSSSNPDRTCL